MTRKILIASALLLSLTLLTLAGVKPNFSGTWATDRQRSFGLPANMQQTMIVAQKDDQIEVETKLIQPDNERSVNDVYVLDGQEREFAAPAPPGQPGPKGKRSAGWLPAGNGILVTEITTSETPKGTVTSQIRKKWTLSSDGELTIDMYIDNPNGSFGTKRVFVRK